jgi:hypothetical protein
MRKPAQASLPVVAIACLSTACATLGGHAVPSPEAARTRVSVLARARVWAPVRVRSVNLKTGPLGPGAIPFQANVSCTYVDRSLGGLSPKFLCKMAAGDIIKVKFGAENGEVYGEVLATRLLWALGFGADRMYPASVTCRGCPSELGGIAAAGNARRFEPASIERLMSGSEWERDGAHGWAWNELNVVNPQAGGATRAERDALKLLAVFLQHSDSKPEQQRILCLGERGPSASGSCRRPFLMISDVGLTFGRASRTNANDASGVNLAAWRDTPIWKDETGCRGNLPRSLTGSLEDPMISEEGRRLLASLLAQLSDRQLRDLFEAGRVELRLRSPGDPSSGFATVREWVEAFKEKRAQIEARRCVGPASSTVASGRG